MKFNIGFLNLKNVKGSIRLFSNMPSDELLTTVINKCGIVTLNRPKALNSLNRNMVNLMYPVLKSWESDEKITHVIIQGQGNKAFCAGGDIRQVTDIGKVDPYKAGLFFRDEYCLNYLIGTFPKPYIALLDGITMGGGFGLSVHGRFRICTEKTVFAMPETAIGLFPDVGGGYFLPRLPGNLGIYLALVGHRLKGRDIVSAGIGTHFIESSKIEELKEKLVEAVGCPDVERVIAELTVNSEKSHNFSLESQLQWIRNHFRFNTVEEIMNSLTNCSSGSDEENKWCLKHAEIMRKMSPSSMKITLKQLRDCKNKSFADVFRVEYRMSVGCLEHHDFYEGVRALLIDKDNKPQWKPASLEEVTDELVGEYFRPLSDDLNL